MDKILILLFFTVSVFGTEFVLDICGFVQDESSIVEGHNEGIPDTDTSETSEYDVEIDHHDIDISLVVSDLALPIDDYRYSFIFPFLETPYLPPEGS